MKRSTSDRYIWDRPESRFLWFRMAVPKAVQARVGKKIELCSLGTADRREAVILAGRKRAELHEAWGLLAPPAHLLPTVARRVPTEQELEEAAVVLGYEWAVEDADAGRRTLKGKGPNVYRAHVNYVRGELEEQVRAVATGDYDRVKDLAEAAVDALDFDLPCESEGYARLCELLSVARLDGLREQHRRNAGEVAEGPVSPLVRRVRDRAAATAGPGESILELFERWAEEVLEKGDKRPDTVNQDRKVIKLFAAFVGADRAIDSITPLEVADYRDTARNLPPKWMSNKELRGLDMRAAAAKARKLGLPKSAFTNVNKHLSTISPLYRWLAAQPAWAGLHNPTNGLFYAKVKGKNPRPPFSTDTLNRILQSPLYTGFRADGCEHLPGDTRTSDWRYWIPLVCMFTGARIGEIAQLRVGDVRMERGVWFIHIRHDEAEGLSTKSGKSRAAAVHPMLERLGLISFHSRRAEEVAHDADAVLFGELSRNSRNQISGTPSRWWRDYLTAIGVKEGRDGKGSHSFRHTLSDRLRSEAELLDNQVAVCLGHSQKTTTSGYGELSQGTVTMLRSYMEAVRFDGVVFEHLIPADPEPA